MSLFLTSHASSDLTQSTVSFRRFAPVIMTLLSLSVSSVTAHEKTSQKPSTPLHVHQTDMIDILGSIPGHLITQEFEGFDSVLTFDPAQNTYCIGYGTDIGEKTSTWPYGTYAEDVALHLEKTCGLSRDQVAKILTGKAPLSRELGRALFVLRYDRRRALIEKRYRDFCGKEFAELPDVVQKMLTDFSYNLPGESGILPVRDNKNRIVFKGFPKACEYLRQGDYEGMRREIMDSHYYSVVGDRRGRTWTDVLEGLSPGAVRPSSQEDAVSPKPDAIQQEMKKRFTALMKHDHRT